MAEFVSLDDYLALPREPQPWVIQDLIPVGGAVNVYGKPKTGKSFIALDWAWKVAQGFSTWEGYPILKPGPVAYLQCDTPREEWARRMEYVRTTAQRDGIPLWIADMWLIPNYPMNIIDPLDPTIEWLKAEMTRIQPVMVVIDTLREVHGGDEDSSTVMRNVISNLVGACRPAAIVLVSHARKDQQGFMDGAGEEDMMDTARGSGYTAGRMDVVVKVTKRRMQFKGRATGLKTETLQQDPENGWISLVRQDDGLEKAIEDLTRQYPGLSQTQMAEKLAKKLGYSVSTATRRLREWVEKVEQGG
jgi:RecA-family ATPase